MTPAERDHLVGVGQALERAREADERLRGALAEATVWLSLALGEDGDDETGDDT